MQSSKHCFVNCCEYRKVELLPIDHFFSAQSKQKYMPWDPEKYNQFKNIRYQPFFDLMEMIDEKGLLRAVDIGCGTGEQTKILAEKFDKAFFMGIDPSPEMLSKSNGWRGERLQFQIGGAEDFVNNMQQEPWDLIFSNAALQWSDNHDELFPRLIGSLAPNGQFAVQMPVQKENLLNRILLEMVQEKPFVDFLDGWKRDSPVLSIDEYAQLMFDAGLINMQIVQKVYPIIAENADQLFDFISGSALIPYMERLSGERQRLFVEQYQSRIRTAVKKFPAIYAFKRLLLYGRKLKP
jgi:trans-aconitate 2-methyltransferase